MGGLMDGVREVRAESRGMKNVRLSVRAQLAVFALALLAFPLGALAQDAQPSAKVDPAMIATAYNLIETTFYKPIDGSVIRAGADAEILAYARKHGAPKTASIPAASASAGAASIVADVDGRREQISSRRRAKRRTPRCTAWRPARAIAGPSSSRQKSLHRSTRRSIRKPSSVSAC